MRNLKGSQQLNRTGTLKFWFFGEKMIYSLSRKSLRNNRNFLFFYYFHVMCCCLMLSWPVEDLWGIGKQILLPGLHEPTAKNLGLFFSFGRTFSVSDFVLISTSWLASHWSAEKLKEPVILIKRAIFVYVKSWEYGNHQMKLGLSFATFKVGLKNVAEKLSIHVFNFFIKRPIWVFL